MESVGAYQAKTHLSKLLDRVAKGERFVIEKHGVPVAVLQPADTFGRPPVKETIAELNQFRMGRRLGEISIRDLIEEGRM